MPRYFALIPAAGSGTRLGGETPKQYRIVAGKPMLHHALQALALERRIERTFLAIGPEDAHWERLSSKMPLQNAMLLRCGGTSRAATVLNALREMERHGVLDNDWILVHDAARPCLSQAALARLIDEIDSDVVGGLLAVPVADTIKRGDEYQRVTATEKRDGLWLAQTPQMFRVGTLRNALADAPLDEISDEAGAIERAGMRPKLVMGECSNIKVTYAADILLAEAILNRGQVLARISKA